jgi:hypothetical protein
MSDDTRRVLELLAQGKVTVEEADQLLGALRTEPSRPTNSPPAADTAEKPRPRFLRIAVHKPAGGHRLVDKDVTIRVPLGIVRSGMRLGAIIPAFAGEHAKARLRENGLDIDFSKLDSAAIDALLSDFGEMNIDVDEGKKTVRISCE